MKKPITIIGGGLGGLALGLMLRRNNIEVTLYDAGIYPRHRVCGEFISGQGLSILEDLGLQQPIMQAGARWASTVQLFFGPRKSNPITLPSSALCLSRWRLDALLAREFQVAGGILHSSSRWTQSLQTPGLVRATGRRIAKTKGEHILGLKVHLPDFPLSADLEMHFGPRAYVGLCRVEGNRVNLCGLFRTPTQDPIAGRGVSELIFNLSPPSLRARLNGLRIDPDSACAVAGLSLLPAPSANLLECAAGDSIAMIPPVTGNGMSLALESARLISGPLFQYATAKLAWTDALQQCHALTKNAFARRLQWSGLFHRYLFSPLLASLFRTPSSWQRFIVRRFFHLTR